MHNVLNLYLCKKQRTFKQSKIKNNIIKEYMTNNYKDSEQIRKINNLKRKHK